MEKLSFKNNCSELNLEKLTEDESIRPEVCEIIKKNPKILEALNKIKLCTDDFTLNHILRVADNTVVVSQKRGLNKEDEKDLIEAALLHDEGKTDEDIAPLVTSEKKIDENSNDKKRIERHVRESVEYCKKIGASDRVLGIIGGHHEKNKQEESKQEADSYPRKNDRRKKQTDNVSTEKRKGKRRKDDEKTKHLARLLSIIDQADALRNGRPYKKPFPPSECKKILKEKFPEKEDGDIIEILTTSDNE